MSSKKFRISFFNFCANVLPYFTVFFVGIYFIFHTSLITEVVAILLVTWLSAIFLKIIFHELRPHHKKAQTLFLDESRFSFPSEHSAVFSALGVFAYTLNPVLGIVLLFIAFLIGISRAIIGIHFWHDIVAGWALGIIIALLFIF